MKKTTLLLLGLLVAGATTAQVDPEAVRKQQQQMREDFEFTMQMLHDCGAIFHTMEYLTGINPFDEARRVFEANIDTVTTFKGFYDVMQCVLSCMCDMHTDFSAPDEDIVHISKEIKQKNEELWLFQMQLL